MHYRDKIGCHYRGQNAVLLLQSVFKTSFSHLSYITRLLWTKIGERETNTERQICLRTITTELQSSKKWRRQKPEVIITITGSETKWLSLIKSSSQWLWMSKTCPEIGHYDATKCDGLKQDIELCKPIGFGKAKIKLQQFSFYKIPDYGVNNGILYANCITLKGIKTN